MRTAISVIDMRKSDALAIQTGTPGKVLMERAGRGVFEAVEWQGKIGIVCGAGNNGGDGYVLAHLLKDHGYACTLFLLSDRFSKDGGEWFSRCGDIEQYDLSRERWITTSASAEEREEPSEMDSLFGGLDCLVDCIFGTGFHGEPAGIEKAAIEAINRAGRKGVRIISVDINSGLNAANGLGELCVRSDLTVSIGSYKPGHFLNKAKDCIGGLINVDIGLPAVEKIYRIPERGDFSDVLVPRKSHSHKGSYGRTVLIGGSLCYSGAAKLANMSCAALRSGCGLCRLAVPESIAGGMLPYMLDSTLWPMPEQEGRLQVNSEMVASLLEGTSSAAVGMGLGKSAETEALVKEILHQKDRTVILDADAIRVLEGKTEWLLQTQNRVILTPHPKEFACIADFSLSEILADPIGCAESFAARFGVTVLLKGNVSVVTDGKTTELIESGCSGMAKGGSGDVLAGILAGLAAYHPDPLRVAACGAYLAGVAGELASMEKGNLSMLASDTAVHVGQAVKFMIE